MIPALYGLTAWFLSALLHEISIDNFWDAKNWGLFACLNIACVTLQASEGAPSTFVASCQSRIRCAGLGKMHGVHKVRLKACNLLTGLLKMPGMLGCSLNLVILRHASIMDHFVQTLVPQHHLTLATPGPW